MPNHHLRSMVKKKNVQEDSGALEIDADEVCRFDFYLLLLTLILFGVWSFMFQFQVAWPGEEFQEAAHEVYLHTC